MTDLAVPLKAWASKLSDLPETEKMPVLFVGHGNPMNVLFDNPFTRALHALPKTLPTPRAILMVSAHWETRGTFVHGLVQPKTIHDFGGFPDEMYQIQYACPGSPEYAKAVQGLVKSVEIQWDTQWGLDHGAWTVLHHMYPEAKVPVFQLSLNRDFPPQRHLELARELKMLRRKGILIIGSGNIVHNLGMVDFSSEDAKPFDWAVEFDEKVKLLIVNRDASALAHYQSLPSSRFAVPTNEHYLPLLYSMGLTDSNEPLSFPYEGILNGSISMRCVRVG